MYDLKDKMNSYHNIEYEFELIPFELIWVYIYKMHSK